MNEYEAKQEARRERLLDRAAKHQAAGEARYQTGRQMFDAIPPGQPILVGHHSEKRDRNYRARAANNMRRGAEQMGYASDLVDRAAAVGTAGVSQDDPDAIDKLRAELAALEVQRDRIKAVNAQIRKAGEHGVVDVTAAEKAELDTLARISPYLEPYKRGFPAYYLSNMGANIRRIKERIAHLERSRATAERPAIVTTWYALEDCPEDNRLKLTLNERVGTEVFKWIRSMGWRWSRTSNAFLAYRDSWDRVPRFLEVLHSRAGWVDAECRRLRSEEDR